MLPLCTLHIQVERKMHAAQNAPVTCAAVIKSLMYSVADNEVQRVHRLHLCCLLHFSGVLARLGRV